MVAQPPKPGRKKIASQERKIRNLPVRLDEAEHAAINAAAEQAGMTVSAFFRSLALEGAGVRPFYTSEDKAVLSLLLENMRKIGVNLNQVARAINSGRAVHPEEIKIALRNVELVSIATSQELRDAARKGGNRRRGEA